MSLLVSSLVGKKVELPVFFTFIEKLPTISLRRYILYIREVERLRMKVVLAPTLESGIV